MENTQQYISKSEFIPDLKLDIAFVVRDDFYYGDENDFTEEEWKTNRELLFKPVLPLLGKLYLLSDNIEGNEQQVLDYYASVIAVSKRYNKKISAGNSYFWMRPVVYKENVDTINFPWYDTMAEALPFLNAIQAKDEGCVFSDMDQGWHLEVHHDKGNTCFIYGSLEESEPYWVVSSNRFNLSEMAKSVKQRIEKQIENLSQHFGCDYWTKREPVDYNDKE